MSRLRMPAVAAAFMLFAPMFQGQATAFDSQGLAEVQHASYLNYLPEGMVAGRNQNLLRLAYESRRGESAAAKASVQFREDHSDARRNRFLLEEAFVGLFLGPFDLYAGKQLIPWGKADFANPTDVLNPRDYTDPLMVDESRLGMQALRTVLHLEGVEVEAIFSPVFQKSLLPEAGTPWNSMPSDMPGIRLSPELLAVPTPSGMEYEAQAALRISTSPGGWDLAFYGGYLRNSIPSIRPFPQGMAGDTVLVAILAEYRRRRMVGADFSTTIGKTGLRGEGACFEEEKETGIPEVDPIYCKSALGVDWSFKGFGDADGFMFLVQGLREWSPKEGARFAENDLNHLFQMALAGRLDYESGGDMTLRLQGLADFAAEDYLIQPEINYRIMDGVVLALAFDFLGGRRNGFFGGYQRNDRMRIKLVYNL